MKHTNETVMQDIKNKIVMLLNEYSCVDLRLVYERYNAVGSNFPAGWNLIWNAAMVLEEEGKITIIQCKKAEGFSYVLLPVEATPVKCNKFHYPMPPYGYN